MSIEDMIRTPWGPMTLATLEGSITDGYHTIKELYEHLDALFARVCLLRKEHSWKTGASTVTEVSVVPELMVGLNIDPGRYIAWYLSLPTWERLDVTELEYIPGVEDSLPDMVHYSLDMGQSAEWLLGEVMPPIKGEEVPNYGYIDTAQGRVEIPEGVSLITFNELYGLRYALFIYLCHGHSDRAWKSFLHEDGSMYDDYFIAGIHLPEGTISYHLPIELWDLMDVTELPTAPPWDGHTPSDVVTRLLAGLQE